MAPAVLGPPLSKRPIRFRALDKVKVYPPALVTSCLERIARGFLEYDTAALQKKLTAAQMKAVYDKLDLDMNVCEAARRIQDEDYWKRRMLKARANCQVREYGLSWKQAFLEHDLAFKLSSLREQPPPEELEALRQQVRDSSGYIFQLKLAELASHVDLQFVFDNCPALCSLDITYGHRRLGMQYERAAFGMKISDAQTLARTFCVSQTLISVCLPSNMIDDELVKILVHGLQHAHMLTYLDLSHNKICDRGARGLAQLFDADFVLHTMLLADNQVHSNGCMHLGAHLAENMTLEHLDLRLNRCEDNGVSHLFHDLAVNKYLKRLNLACNDLTVRCLAYLSSMLNDNRSLEELDISANPLYSTEGEEKPEEEAAAPLELPGLEDVQLAIDRDSPLGIFVTCVASNPTLTKLDLRKSALPADMEDVLTTMVKHKELRKRGIPVDAYERRRGAKKAAEEAEAAEEEEGEEVEGEEAEEGAGDEERAEDEEEGEEDA